MKPSIRKSKFIAAVPTNIFPLCSVGVSGFIICMLAGRFSASLQLTNDYVAPVSSIADTANLRVFSSQYKKPYCILMLLSSG